MGLLKFTLTTFISLLFLACEGEVSSADLFEIKLDGKKREYFQSEQIEVSIKNKKNKKIDRVRYSIDGQILEIQNNTIKLDIVKLGNKTLKAVIEYEENTAEISINIRVLAKDPPTIYTYEIINQYPHDIKAFTQGLEFFQDTLYEGTGSGGMAKSFIRKIVYQTGEILLQKDLESPHFGEGITLLNDKLYQLTWKSGFGRIYDLSHFNNLGEFKYGKSREGWGLCNDGTNIYKSDGTEKIWLLDPNTLQELSFIEIVTNKSIFNMANELEYVNGKIYANVWQKESIMIINATSGAIEGVINMAGLKEKVKQHNNLDVLNGIAYHPERKTFFVTGKNWDTLFEVTFTPK
jgi:glutamine cyclotransferase